MSTEETKISVKQDGKEVAASLADLMNMEMDGVQPNYGFENLEGGTFEFRFKEFEPKAVDVRVDRKNPNSETIPRPVIACKLEVIGVRKTKNATTDHNELLGKEHNENFFITELEKGMGGVQALLLGMGLSGQGTLRSLLEQAINVDFVATIKTKKNKDDPSIEYSNLDLKSVQALAAPTTGAPAALNVGTEVVTQPEVAAAPSVDLATTTAKAADDAGGAVKLNIGG